MRRLRKLLLDEGGASWTFNLEFLKAKAARSLGMGMTEFEKMTRADKAEAMALLVAKGWMRAWESRDIKRA